MKSHDIELKRLKRLRKIDECSLDLVFYGNYLAGNFNQEIPVEFSRKALKIIIEKLSHKRV